MDSSPTNVDPLIWDYAKATAAERNWDVREVYNALIAAKMDLMARLGLESTGHPIGDWAYLGFELALNQKEFKSSKDKKRAHFLERIFQHGGYTSDLDLIRAIKEHGTGRKDVDALFNNMTTPEGFKNSISRGRRELGIDKKVKPES